MHYGVTLKWISNILIYLHNILATSEIQEHHIYSLLKKLVHFHQDFWIMLKEAKLSIPCQISLLPTVYICKLHNQPITHAPL